MGRSITVLLVEDDDAIAGRIQAVLSELEWNVHRCADGTTAINHLAEKYDVVILDRILPDAEGLSLLGDIRRNNMDAPVLILSSLGQTRHRIEGLDAGGDDYLTKPFDPDELVARIRSLLRRQKKGEMSGWEYVGDFAIHSPTKTLHFQGSYINLSSQEFSIFYTLIQVPGELVSRATIWQEAWPTYSNLPPRQNVIDVGISRLRKKLAESIGHDPIESVRARGFLLRIEA